jgi:hypothetical protein
VVRWAWVVSIRRPARPAWPRHRFRFPGCAAVAGVRRGSGPPARRTRHRGGPEHRTGTACGPRRRRRLAGPRLVSDPCRGRKLRVGLPAQGQVAPLLVGAFACDVHRGWPPTRARCAVAGPAWRGRRAAACRLRRPGIGRSGFAPRGSGGVHLDGQRSGRRRPCGWIPPGSLGVEGRPVLRRGQLGQPRRRRDLLRFRGRPGREGETRAGRKATRRAPLALLRLACCHRCRYG